MRNEYIHVHKTYMNVHDSTSRKQSKCPLPDEWINKILHIHSKEDYLAIKTWHSMNGP
jgi:hypothetical protein